jgi:hypothetical protein
LLLPHEKHGSGPAGKNREGFDRFESLTADRPGIFFGLGHQTPRTNTYDRQGMTTMIDEKLARLRNAPQ